MSIICLSEDAQDALKHYIRLKGHQIVEIKRTTAVYEAVSAHSDLYLCRIKNERILSPEQNAKIGSMLRARGISYTIGSPLKGSRYPDNIAYNAAWAGSYLIHNLKYTDPAILKKTEELGLETVHVKQGYTKCSLVVVDEQFTVSLAVPPEGLMTKSSSMGISPLTLILRRLQHL
ncbi:MAG: hypothetical protein K0Q48_1461 [Bacillota bacterium]|nr:hypothetical protein [Bacillota bacterium]